MSKPSVFWIGPRTGKLYLELVARLGARGLSVIDIESAEAPPETLRLHAKAVIVVCDQGSEGMTRRVLESLHAGLRNSPVIVLVERSEFGDYYDMMNRGANYYYEQSENPRRIAQAVWWAANTRAA